MREQVCTYMCPWPRIQGAMLDEHSLVVTYNDWRGEPRSRHRKKLEIAGERAGDCVDCNACVAVCPAGIDIRDGQQLECISCALCIDACDQVMDKVGLPKGLISYSTLNAYEAHKAGKPIADFSWREIIRPRTLIYTAGWAAIGVAMLIALGMRDRMDISVRHDRNPQFVQLSDGGIRNGYTILLMNMQQRPRIFEVSAANLTGAKLAMTGSDEAPADKVAVEVAADKLRAVKIFVTVPPDFLSAEQTPFTFNVTAEPGSPDAETREQAATFVAPSKEAKP
jgi:cytochrome c oxidase accessory protein FixG